MSKRPLLIATSNPGKLRELRSLLADLPFDLIGLTDIPNIQIVDEYGSTFIENATLKAVGYAAQARVLTLADDSGLEVDALNGAPGVRSARYVDPSASYADRIRILLHEVEKTGDSNRTARFVCAVAVAASDGNILYVTQKTCEGRLAESPRGKGGFGYDPIFIPDYYDQTFGELPADLKNQISHRAVALLAARGFLASLTTPRSDG
ncbi:MAG TPA: RdgB/HAM1 family non-canonical purine NTP pyrophosphatase [Pyrinomonadaceae bacterium]